MSAPAKGEIAILVDQIAAVEAALAESGAELERLRGRAHRSKRLLAEALIVAAERAIAAPTPRPRPTPPRSP